MATEVHLDALPYIDHGYDEPGVREEVEKATLGYTLVYTFADQDVFTYSYIDYTHTHTCLHAGYETGWRRDKAIQIKQELSWLLTTT